MMPPLPSPLPHRDLALLRVASYIVPPDDRQDWLRCWQAELWHRRHPRTGGPQPARDLVAGLLRDALWLRGESLRRALAGTAMLCLLTLAALAGLASLPLLACLGEVTAVLHFLGRDLPRFLVELSLTSVVGFLFAGQTTMHLGRQHPLPRLRASLFAGAQLTLLQVVAYLFSLDITLPFHPQHAFASEILQPQIFALIALVALRWGFEDHGTRCRHCLRSLAAPLRIGRPSWNLLESNGTHLVCPEGHGLLSVPEMETSWRHSSEWIVPS